MQGKDHHKVHSCPIYTSHLLQFFGEKDMVLLILVVPEMCEKKGITVNVKHHYSLLFPYVVTNIFIVCLRDKLVSLFFL